MSEMSRQVDDAVMTVKEVKQALGLCGGTVYSLIASKKLQAVRTDGSPCWFVLVPSLIRWCNRHGRDTGPIRRWLDERKVQWGLNLDEHLTRNQVAKLLGVHPETVATWMKRGLPHMGRKIGQFGGGAWIIRRTDLIRWLGDNGYLHLLRNAQDAGVSVVMLAALPLRLQAVRESRKVEEEVRLHRPNMVVMDFAIGRDECIDLAMRLHNDHPRPVLAGITYDDEGEHPVKAHGLFDVLLPHPVTLADVMAEAGRSMMRIGKHG